MSMVEREAMEFDVVIVGAGPAGLATAIRLMQLAEQHEREVSVVVLEKGSEVGAHILSGAVIEPRALTELFPDWKSDNPPLVTEARRDEIVFLTGPDKSFETPHWMAPHTMHNEGNYVGSLGKLTRWLAEKAEAMGVEIFPGFAAAEVLFHDDGSIKGVATGDMGIGKDGEPKDGHEPGMELHARYTVFAEGCRGHLGKQLIEHFALDAHRDPQHYGIGIKELWEIEPDKHEQGLVVHGAGWPLSESGSSGGFFLYHIEDNQVVVGLITDLSYSNPHLSPFHEFQRLKHHPKISATLEGGKRLVYGARAIAKGGLHSLPKMSMPGALLVGCNAGTLNYSKIKGTHTAMKSGMVAAETLFEALADEQPEHQDLVAFETAFRESWAGDELFRSRNFGSAMHKFGTWGGGAWNYIEQNVMRGRLPINLHDRKPDYAQLKLASEATPIDYPKPDGKLSFDKSSSVFLSNTNHEEDQPSHLRLTDRTIPIQVNLVKWDEPAQRYCPVGVYEVIEEDGKKIFQINAQNCIHCKTCDIKDPSQNITWVCPEGGGGPNYPNM